MNLKTFKSVIKKLIFSISPVIATKLIYYWKFKKKLNLNEPVDFNEKIQWLKLYWQDKKIVRCADKFRVREYLKDNDLQEYLIPLIASYDTTEQIEWEKLPGKYVIKTNNASGTNIIVKDSQKVDINQYKNKIDDWLSNDFSLHTFEPQYSHMKPKIIIEELIGNGEPLVDYRIFCFNGVPQFLYVSIDGDYDENGFSNKKVRKMYLDFNWNVLEYGNNNLNEISSEEKPDKPANLEEMILIAKKLSHSFPFVRIDLYNKNGKIYFGEMTFTPSGGMADYYNKESLIKLGNMIELPKEKKLDYKC